MTYEEEKETADRLTVQLRLFGLTQFSCNVVSAKRDKRFWIWRRGWSGSPSLFVEQYFTTLDEMTAWVHETIEQSNPI